MRQRGRKNRQGFQMLEKWKRGRSYPIQTPRFACTSPHCRCRRRSRALRGTSGADTPRVSSQDRLESAVLDELNLVRLEHGLRQLRINPKLTAAADHHSLAMVRSGYFAHESPDGGHFAARIKGFYKPRAVRRWTVGENLIWQERRLSGAGRRDGLAREPRPPREPPRPGFREVGISAVRASARPASSATTHRRPHGRLRRAIADPRRGRRYPSPRAPVAQWKSSGLLSRRSGVRILPGAPLTRCGRRRRAGGSRASRRTPRAPALREQRVWLPRG